MNINTYQKITSAMKPLFMLYLAKRKRQGKEDNARFNERTGMPKIKRPTGKLIWLHGASVGETVSMLPLIKKIQTNFPGVHILVTSGTVTSANIMKKRLPAGAIHQYVPVDIKKYTDAFIAHWKPNLALWFESDFWPNLMTSTSSAKIPMILVNGRISDRSFKRWRFAKGFIADMLSKFDLALGQTKEDAVRLKLLGAKKAVSCGNLKYAAMDLPCNEDELLALQTIILDRKVIMAASTHYDEEMKIADVFAKLRYDHPSLMLIILPRHPKRGKEIAYNLSTKGFRVALRSDKDTITQNTEIYVADTIGEMGLFYRLADIVFVGGSLVPHGGQNFLEPARLGAAIVVGPYMHNFTEMTQNAVDAKAVSQVKDSHELLRIFADLLTNDNKKDEYIARAKDFACKENAVLDKVYEKLLPFI